MRRRLEVEAVGDVTVVNFLDRKILDEHEIHIIGHQLFNLVEEGRKKIILNFGNVTDLSNAILGKLITLNKKLQQANGHLVLCCLIPEMYEVFEITKLNRLLDIRKDKQVGLSHFR